MLITALRSDCNSPPLTADSVPSPALLASVSLQFQRRFGPDFVDSIFFVYFRFHPNSRVHSLEVFIFEEFIERVYWKSL